jgi:hypothetical protein
MAKQIIRALVALLATLTLIGCSSQPRLGQYFGGDTTVTKPATAPATGVASVPVAPQSAPVAKPSAPQGQDATVALPSTQPFQQFKRGAGEGYAFKYRPRSKEDVVKMLRDPKAQKEMRVPCKVWVTQIAEAHKLPFEGCEGAAAVIEKDSDYKVEKCNDAMFQKNWLLVTNEKGDKFGAWHRKCYPGEKVLTYKGQPISSTECMNPVIPITPVAVSKPVQPPAPAPSACVATQKIRLVVWEAKAGEVSGVKETIAKASGSSYYDASDVSRGFGKVFRAEKSAGRLNLGKKSTPVVISLLKANGTEEKLFSGSVVGSHSFTMPSGFVEGDVLRVLFTGPMTSPTSSEFGPEIRARRDEFRFAKCESEVHLNAIEK